MVDGRFFGHFFWKVVGTVRIHVSHVQLPYTVINVWRINVWVEGHSHVGLLRLFAPVAFCGHSRVQSKCSKGCVCECDRIVVTVSLDNSRLGWLTLCQE